MKVETLTVKLLRSGESYTNDSTEIRVVLEDGDDWTSIERELRQKAEALIEAHWEQKRAAEEAARKAEQVERDKRLETFKVKRDEYLDAFIGDTDLVCNNCPMQSLVLCGKCDDCDHYSDFIPY